MARLTIAMDHGWKWFQREKSELSPRPAHQCEGDAAGQAGEVDSAGGLANLSTKLGQFGRGLLTRTDASPSPPRGSCVLLHASGALTRTDASPSPPRGSCALLHASGAAKKPSLYDDRFPGLRLLESSRSAATGPSKSQLAEPSSVAASGLTAEGDFETPELKAKRRWLRFKPEIRKQIQQLWEVVATDGGRMPACEYLDYHRSAFAFVMSTEGNEFDESLAWETAMADFKSDGRGQPALTFDMFFESVFELADLWTNSVKVADYVRFIRSLRENTAVMSPSGKLEWAQQWPRELHTKACRRWLALARERWLESIPVPQPPQKGEWRRKRSPVQRQVVPRRPKTEEEELQVAARRGMSDLGAVPGQDGLWPTLGLRAFREALKSCSIVVGEAGTRSAEPSFAHALFRVCDADQDGVISLPDLEVALSASSGRRA